MKHVSQQTDLEPHKTLRRLHRGWLKAVLISGLILLGGFSFLAYDRPYLNPIQWTLQTAVISVYVLGLLRIGLPLNYHPEQRVLFLNLGIGTRVTMIRAMLVAVLGGYLFQPWPPSSLFAGRLSWAPGTLYILASVLDYVDGLVARVYRHETRLGAFLDINIDALGLLIAPLLAVWYGQLPFAYLSVGIAYYLFVIGIWLRKKYQKPVFELKPRRSARLVAGFQMGFVGIALLPVFCPPVTTAAAYILMIPLLAGFIKDWLFVCGSIKKNSLPG